MGGTISDWIIEMQRRGDKCAAALHSEKLEDYRRLKESGLPIFEDLIIPFLEFNEGNGAVSGFLAKHDSFVVRAIPDTKELPRRYKIGVKNFEECMQFLRENVRPEDGAKYSIFLTEFEPQTMAGAIISRGDDVLIEIARGNLDVFSHGGTTPIGEGHFGQHGFSHTRCMRYSSRNKNFNRLLWNTLQYLRLEDDYDDQDFNVRGFKSPQARFMRGYFEFVVTKRSGVKFLDYKVNEAYLGGDVSLGISTFPGGVHSKGRLREAF
jgi:hypothetical protein